MKKDPSHNRQQLGNLIDRYKHIIKPPQASVQKQAIKTIENITTLILREDQIVYNVHTRTLTIKAPSLIRSELAMSYGAILEALKTELGPQNAPHQII